MPPNGKHVVRGCGLSAGCTGHLGVFLASAGIHRVTRELVVPTFYCKNERIGEVRGRRRGAGSGPSEDASGCGGQGAGPRSDSGCPEVGAGSWARQAGGGCGGAGAVEAEGGRKSGPRGAVGCVNSAVSPSGAVGGGGRRAGGSGATTLDEGHIPLVRVRSGPPGPLPSLPGLHVCARSSPWRGAPCV